MADLETIQRITGETAKKVDELCLGVATINQRCEDRLQKLDGHGRTLFGEDGSGGLCKVVTVISEKVNKDESSSTKSKTFFMGILQKLIVWGIIGILIWQLTMWKLH